MSSTTSSWLLSFALVTLVMSAPVDDAAAQPTPRGTTAPRATTGPGGLPSTVTTALPSARVYPLPTISYGAPMPPPANPRAFDARISRFENVTVEATVNGRTTSRQLMVLNGRGGIENAPGVSEKARRLLGMHVRKLNLSESTVYFFDPQVAAEWLATRAVPMEPLEDEEEDDDDGGSGCGIQSFGNCVSDPVGALQDGVDAVEAEFERARDRAEGHWNDSIDALADEWDEALNCFSDHVLPGGTVPVRFDITPAMTVNLSESGSRGSSASGNVTGSVGLGLPMDGDLQAKVDFFYIPCLPFIVRPRSITVTGDLTVGEVLAIQATATGEFNKRYTIPPTGGPRIPIQVIPIIIGGVPIAVIDVSAYIEGDVEVTANGSVVGNATLSNEHKSTFDFTCDGRGCRTGSRGQPTASTPVTTTESVQIEGKVTAKPGIYTALMVTLNVNVLGARLGPKPFLSGTAVGCGAATATQTNGADSTGAQNAALAADLDWGVDFRAEALVGGQVVGDKFERVIIPHEDNHIWFRDLIPGGSSALHAAIAGPTEAATSQPTAYKLRMPSCYPYEEDTKYVVTWTGNATPSAVPTNACEWETGRGECEFDPQRELEVRLAWPAEGNYSLAAAVLGDEHRTFEPAPLPTELMVAVTGAPSPAAGGDAGGGSTATTPDRGARGGAAPGTTSTTVRPGAGSRCCDIVPNPTMRGRLGRVVVAYPEKVSARIDVFRAGETEAVAGDYGDQAFDLFPGTYDVTISGKRITGVTVRSGSDTRIKVGVLRVTASSSTRVDVVDPADGRALTGDFGPRAYGLPIGEVGVRIRGQTETVVIEPGQVTDF